MEIIYYVIVAVVAIAIGCGVTLAVTKKMAHSSAKNILDEARLEADVMKKNKMLEAKEEEMKMKAELEKEANARLSKVQAAEARAKQRELQLNQMQSDLQRKRNEVDAQKASLDSQGAAMELRQAELDKMQKKAQETLEHISGLSAEEAKEKLVESLKDEAKTAAASYINDIMDEAKLPPTRRLSASWCSRFSVWLPKRP